MLQFVRSFHRIANELDTEAEHAALSGDAASAYVLHRRAMRARAKGDRCQHFARALRTKEGDGMGTQAQ